jgi:hypothetical protein
MTSRRPAGRSASSKGINGRFLDHGAARTIEVMRDGWRRMTPLLDTGVAVARACCALRNGTTKGRHRAGYDTGATSIHPMARSIR